MPRQLLVQGQVYRLQPPRKPGPTTTKPGRALPWRLAVTAGLGLATAGIVALLGHGGAKDPAPPQVAGTASATKPAANARKPGVAVPAPAPAPSAQVAPAPPAAVAVSPAPAPAAQPSASPPQAGSSPDRTTALSPAPPSPAGPTPLPGDAPGTGRFDQSPSIVAPASPPAYRDPMSQPAPAPGSMATLVPPPAPGRPPAAPAAEPASNEPDALSAPKPPGAIKASVPSTPEAPTECLPEGLNSVLADLGARFGPLTLVSTTHLHTDNHSPGSARAKMHEACSAVDFKVAGASQPVVAYLKKRPEVNGINLYRNNGVIHIDASGPPKAARSATQQDDEAEVARPKPRTRTARPGSGTTEAGNAARGSRTEKAAPTAADDGDQPDVTSTKSVTKGAAAKRRASRVVPRAPTASRPQQTEYEKAFDSQGNPRNGPASE